MEPNALRDTDLETSFVGDVRAFKGEEATHFSGLVELAFVPAGNDGDERSKKHWDFQASVEI